MPNRLYVVPASHPCACVMAALQLKGIEYERVDLLPLVHVAHQRVVFGQRTVPGLKLESGEKIVGSREILRRLDQLVPEPPLVPADGALRARVEEAEAWGDRVFQPIGRRVLWPALKRSPKALASYAEGAKLPIPMSVAMVSAGATTRLEMLLNRASADTTRSDLRALPSHLDRIDAWIDDGLLGGEQPNSADLQIGATVRLLDTVADLRPVFARRPARALAHRLFPAYPGEVPAGALAPEWLSELAPSPSA